MLVERPAATQFIASGWLVLRLQNRLCRLHHQSVGILEAIRYQLIRIGYESLHVDRRVAALSVVEAAEPNSKIFRIGHLIGDELTASDLRDVKHHLRSGCPRAHADGEDKSGYRDFLQDFLPVTLSRS